MGIQNPLNKTQIEILKMFNRDLSEEDLLELKRVFTKFMSQKAATLANKVWDEKGWSEKDMDKLSEEHLRTTYNK